MAFKALYGREYSFGQFPRGGRIFKRDVFYDFVQV
jgi:hypothetical protein